MENLMPLPLPGRVNQQPGPELEDADKVSDELARELMGEYLSGESWMVCV